MNPTCVSSAYGKLAVAPRWDLVTRASKNEYKVPSDVLGNPGSLIDDAIWQRAASPKCRLLAMGAIARLQTFTN